MDLTRISQYFYTDFLTDIAFNPLIWNFNDWSSVLKNTILEIDTYIQTIKYL